MNRPLSYGLSVILSLVAAGESFGGFINVPGDKGDGYVDVNGLPQNFDDPTLRAGTGGNNVRGLAPVFFFALPALPSRDSLAGVVFDIQYLGFASGSPGIFVNPEFNIDFYGLGARSTPTILSTDYYDGDSSLSPDTLMAKGFITPTTATGTLQLSGATFTNYLRSLYNPDGTPMAAFAVFRANADIHLPDYSGRLRGYELASANNTDAAGANVPRLGLTVVPEPSSLVLSLVGAAFLTGCGWRRSRTPRCAVRGTTERRTR
jgi:hypothetical protein